MAVITAIIPVKGDSSRLSHKNILPFGDSNLLIHKIRQLKAVSEVRNIIVSSDSDEMLRNMERLASDVAWMVEKFDYRNKDADWKDSKDAIQRGMQKLKGGYPADGPYKMNK